MKTELLYLVLVTALTGLIWVPYILDRIATRGLMDAVGYPATISKSMNSGDMPTTNALE